MDSEGLAAWLASELHLVGLVLIRDGRARPIKKARAEIRRVGLIRFCDVVAFKVYHRLKHRRMHSSWVADQIAGIKRAYPGDLSAIPRLITDDPNSRETGQFLSALRPDIVVARCKLLLRPRIFSIARFGTFVIHPGICPQYRNAHGCFWALARRDLENVGMTLLKIDKGVDTGPVYLRASYCFDEGTECYETIQYRVVLENLDRIAAILRDVCAGRAKPLPKEQGVKSGTWGQPWLTEYLKWQKAARARAYA